MHTPSLQKQLAGMAVDPEEFVNSLAPGVRARVEALQGLQGEHDELEKAFKKEKRELEEKYAALYAPLYSQRAEIVAGDKAVPAAEAAADDKDVKGIPGFWATVLGRAEMVLNEKDADALTYLTDITCESVTGTAKAETANGGEEEVETVGFRLNFKFRENPYFNNTVLTKTYHMLDDTEPVLEKAEGCSIDWKPGKNCTVKVMKKKPKKGGKPDAKPQTKIEQVESFFNFFNPPSIPDEEDAELEGSEMEALHDEIEADYDMADAIRTKLIPHAVGWFTGEAMEDDEYDFGDDEDEDEDDEDDDDDSEDEGRPPKRKGGRGRGRAAGAGGEQPQECKQQ